MLKFPQIIVRKASTKIVTWSDGTDEEIKAMLEAADAGKINLSDYWSVGDERTVHLSAMTAGDGLNTAQPEQDVIHVLMDTGENSGYTDVNGKPVNFVWGQKDCLYATGRMNTSNTNTGSWNGCAMRADLNDKYYNALPATYKSCLKQFNVITAQTYNGSTNQTSLDYVSLFAAKEFFGSQAGSNAKEAAVLKRIKYYETAANIIKKLPANDSAYPWFLRSPVSTATTDYCRVTGTGSAATTYAATRNGVAPFGCI